VERKPLVDRDLGDGVRSRGEHSRGWDVAVADDERRPPSDTMNSTSGAASRRLMAA
jgi:hypothetical protein